MFQAPLPADKSIIGESQEERLPSQSPHDALRLNPPPSRHTHREISVDIARRGPAVRHVHAHDPRAGAHPQSRQRGEILFTGPGGDRHDDRGVLDVEYCLAPGTGRRGALKGRVPRQHYTGSRKQGEQPETEKGKEGGTKDAHGLALRDKMRSPAACGASRSDNECTEETTSPDQKPSRSVKTLLPVNSFTCWYA